MANALINLGELLKRAAYTYDRVVNHDEYIRETWEASLWFTNSKHNENSIIELKYRTGISHYELASIPSCFDDLHKRRLIESKIDGAAHGLFKSIRQHIKIQQYKSHDNCSEIIDLSIKIVKE